MKFIALILIFNAAIVFASNTTDSLEKVISSANGIEKIDAMNTLAKVMLRNKSETTLSYCNEIIKLSQNIRYKNGEADALANLAYYYEEKQKYDKALQNYLKSLELYQKIDDKKMISKLFHNIGLAYFNISKNQKAVEFFNKSIQIKKELDDQQGIATTYIKLGILYNDQCEYQKAVQYYEKALKIMKKIGDELGTGMIYNNLGVTLYEWKRYQSALEHYKQALEIARKINSEIGIALCLNNVGTIYWELNILDSAEVYFNKSLALKKEIGYLKGITYTLNNIGLIHRKKKEYNKALEYYFEANEYLVKSPNNKELIRNCMNIGTTYFYQTKYDSSLKYLKKAGQLAEDEKFLSLQVEIYLQLFKLYMAINNDDQALKYFDLYKSVNDSLFQLEANKSISEMEVKFKTEKKEKEIELLRKDNIIRRNQLYFMIIISGLVLAVAFLIYRRLQRKKITNEILGEKIIHIKKAENELEEKTEDLRQANIRLQEADRLKSIFLASMSHELRTPLNSIIGFTGILLMGMVGEISDEQKQHLSKVERNANHLLSLINDILDISKIEAGKAEVSLEEFELGGVVREVIDSVSPMMKEKGLELITDVPDSILLLSDRRRVKQILMNLVSNAVKFTDQGNIKIAAKVIENEKVEIRVTDTGIGIKAEEMNKLFNPFQQIDISLTKRHEGTGLGLYLCKRLLALLGGDIRAKSEYGKGSEFTLIIPLKIEEKQ